MHNRASVGDQVNPAPPYLVCSAMRSPLLCGVLCFPSNRGGFPYAAAGWCAASFSYWIGGINAVELCRRRLL
jgi:hypothetical protein